MDIDSSLSIFRRYDLTTQFLLTNGLGGYALGSVHGINTRRYDGLLIAAAAPPVGRVVALHSVIDEIVIDGTSHALATQQFGEDPLLHPDGWRRLTEIDPRPPNAIRWTFAVQGLLVTRTLRLLPGRNAASIEYQVARGTGAPSRSRGGDAPENAAESGRGEVSLRVRPFTPLRDFHSLGGAWDSPPQRDDAGGEQSAQVRRGELALEIRGHPGGGLRDAPQWWHDFAYTGDRERGQEWHEDVWSPGVFEISLDVERRGGGVFTLTAELVQPHHAERPPSRRTAPPALAADPLRRLARAGDQFIVSRRVGAERFASVIAGYPWFADWGRDSMISIPGLMLCTGREADAEGTLLAFARNIGREGADSREDAGGDAPVGLVPNRFDDYTGRPHYNTVDASLWFVHAVNALDEVRRGRKGWRKHRRRAELLDACRAIIAAYRRGTAFNIHIDEDDALIVAGTPQTQLTWMDAQREGRTFTPRHGKPVEINALWHHALLCMAEMCGEGPEATEFRALAARAAESFRSAFWWEERSCLYDVLIPPALDRSAHGAGSEAHEARAGSMSGPAVSVIAAVKTWPPSSESRSLRPNQIFAVSLPHSPLLPEQQRAVVRAVRERLLTPFGLRTLEPGHPSYVGRFEGDLMQRDGAYHQGTVWPWLLGPYCEALLRVGGFSAEAKREARAALAPLIAELDTGCLGQIAEVYDGDPPHRAAGCPAQAWSVAETLRAWVLSGE
jgi:glycogen debranching enzyme